MSLLHYSFNSFEKESWGSHYFNNKNALLFHIKKCQPNNGLAAPQPAGHALQPPFAVPFDSTDELCPMSDFVEPHTVRNTLNENKRSVSGSREKHRIIE